VNLPATVRAFGAEIGRQVARALDAEGAAVEVDVTSGPTDYARAPLSALVRYADGGRADLDELMGEYEDVGGYLVALGERVWGAAGVAGEDEGGFWVNGIDDETQRLAAAVVEALETYDLEDSDDPRGQDFAAADWTDRTDSVGRHEVRCFSLENEDGRLLMRDAAGDRHHVGTVSPERLARIAAGPMDEEDEPVCNVCAGALTGDMYAGRCAACADAEDRATR